MGHPPAILSCLLLALGVAGCQQDRTIDQKPVWSDLEQQNRAHRGTRSEATASASEAPGATPAQVAMPLSVDPLPDVCAVSDRSKDLVAGEQVLVSPIRVNFALAKVVKPEDDGSVVVATRHGNEFVAAAEQVYALRPSRHSRAKPHCYGACKPVSGWIPCLVSGVQGSQILARDRDGKGLTLRSSEVIVFDPAVQTHVRAFFTEAAHERAFREQVARTGGVRRPPGYHCAEHEVVLADFGDRYLLAQVIGAKQESCRVKWLTSSMAPGVRPASAIVPLPTAYDKPPVLVAGDFVLAHARGELSKREVALTPGSDEVRSGLPDELWGEWEPMRVEAIYLDGRMLLSNAKNKQHQDSTSKVVAYRNPRPAAKPATK